MEGHVRAIAWAGTRAINRTFDAKNNLSQTIAYEAFRSLDEPKTDLAHDGIVKCLGAVEIVGANGDAVDHDAVPDRGVPIAENPLPPMSIRRAEPLR